VIFTSYVVNNLVHNKAYHIFTHKDLDGAVSLLTFIWSKPESYISYNEITNLEIHKIKEYINRTVNPPTIILLDIPLRDEFLPELDKPFITIIDHHERSLPLVDKFKHSKILHKEFTSNCLLLRKILQDKISNLSDDQKKLILYADDYDCFNLKYTESYDLNIIFWHEFKNNFNKFIEYYKNGFVPFTKEQKTLINEIKAKTKNAAESLKCFSFELKIENENRSIIATMSDHSDTLIHDYIINKYKPDLFIFINTKKEKISLKQNKNQQTFFDLNKFAEKYCNGSGNKFSASGKITPMFMELTKNFKPL
jgi:hypothetical protein